MKVVFLACTKEFGFGYGANITKIGYMAKGLREAGATCVIHNGIVGSTKMTADQCVEHDGFKVTTYKQQGSQHISWIKNLGKTYRYLKAQKESGKQNIAIVELDLYHIMLAYYIMLMMLGYKAVTISHEWGPTLKGEKKLKFLSHCIFAKTFGWFSDGILPISEYIIKKIEHFKKPYFKLPIMADFEEVFEPIKSNEKSFVYCASVYYTRIINMIISAYENYQIAGGNIKLTLVLNGPENYKQEIADSIKQKGLTDFITIKSKLPYKELLNEYYNAMALIIPLDPNYEQDEARFSQKIAEYLSSKSPIITNNVGEIKYYFNDDEIIKCEYSEEGFAKAFQWVDKNTENAKSIGINGYKRGKKEFDYKYLGKGMYNFFKEI